MKKNPEYIKSMRNEKNLKILLLYVLVIIGILALAVVKWETIFLTSFPLGYCIAKIIIYFIDGK